MGRGEEEAEEEEEEEEEERETEGLLPPGPAKRTVILRRLRYLA